MAKKGRPPVEDPRKHQYRIRMNGEENDLLTEAMDLTGMGVSDVLRESVRRLAEEERLAEHIGKQFEGEEFVGEE